MVATLKPVLRAPKAIAASILGNRELLWQLTKRNVMGRYRGSYLGLLWSFFHPLLMLAVYTFVFSVILNVRWGAVGSDSRVEYALTLFAGFTLFNMFSEVINRSPSLVLSNPNYVKKVIFPLEILPVAVMGEALFHALVSLVVLVGGVGIFLHNIPWTIVLLPVVCIPVILLTLGLSWFLSSFGVFVRDVASAVGIFTTVLFFMTPIIYPITLAPERLAPFLKANPLAVLIESCRQVVLWGEIPDWTWFFYATLLSLVCFCCGFVFFERTKKSFADVM